MTTTELANITETPEVTAILRSAEMRLRDLPGSMENLSKHIDALEVLGIPTVECLYREPYLPRCVDGRRVLDGCRLGRQGSRTAHPPAHRHR